MTNDVHQPPQASVAVVMLTPECDMVCPYCGAESAFKALTEEQAHGLMPVLAAQGFSSVVLGGGEPFCWKGDLRELAGAAKRAGLLTQVGTNLQRLPAAAPSWKEVDRWVLPLESASAEEHDVLRPAQASHHALVLRSLDAFRAAGATVTVSSVAHDGSADLLDGVARVLRRRRDDGLKLHAWHIYRFQTMGRGGRRNAGRFFLDDAQWRTMSQGLKASHPDLPILLRPDLLHSKQVAFFWGTVQGLWRQGPLQWSGSVLRPDPERALAF